MGRARVLRNGVPVVELLAAKLRRQLEGGKARPGELITSEYDLARSEKVNRMVARRAVDVLIAEGKLERRPGKGVYAPGTGAQTRSANVAERQVRIVVPNLTVGMWSEMARGAKGVASKMGVQALIYDAHDDVASDLQAIRQLPQTAPGGAIIVSIHHKRFTEIVYELKLARYPFVLVDERPHGIEIPSVVSDSYHGGYLVGRELVHRGHRRVGFVGFLQIYTARARLSGLRDAILDAHLPFDRAIAVDLPGDAIGNLSDRIGAAIRQILCRPIRPTGIFFSHDLAAAEGYRVIRDLGLRIPQDVSVVGFDGIQMCRMLTPSLATVRQPVREMGIVAMEMLLALMAGSRKDEWPPRRVNSRRRAEESGQEFMARSVSDGLGDNGHGGAVGDAVADTATGGQAGGHEVSLAGRRVAPMETNAPIAVANKTQNHDSDWHRVLPVTWQDGESIGPAPGAAGDFPTQGHEEREGD